MKKTIGFTLLGCILTTLVSAQSITNSLKGYYKSTSKNDLYTSFYFNGDGHALINDGYPAEYVQVENIVYLFPDKSVFVFELKDKNLIGKSNWVEKATYKTSTIPDFGEEITIPQYTIVPNLLYEFYKINYEIGTDQPNYDFYSDYDTYTARLKNLCDKGLTTACGGYFGLLYIESLGGIDQLLDSNTHAIKPNKEIEKIGELMIQRGDIRGYGLLGSYYLAIGNNDKAKEYLEKGTESGDLQSATLQFELEMDNLNEE